MLARLRRVGSPAIAALGRIRVVAVDYRQQPEHRFPAASEDVAAVYRELLKTYRPKTSACTVAPPGHADGHGPGLVPEGGLPTPGEDRDILRGLTTGASAFGGDASYITLAAGEGRAPPPPPAPGAQRRVMAYLEGVDPPTRWPRRAPLPMFSRNSRPRSSSPAPALSI